MKPRLRRWMLYMAFAALYLLHNDLWLWNEPRRVWGLPLGLLYHIGFCAAAALLMIGLVAWAWPPHLEEGENP